jgi:hypothetical protein
MPRDPQEHYLSEISSPFFATRLFYLALLLCCTFACIEAQAEVIELRPTVVEKGGIVSVEYRSGDALVGRSTDTAPAGVELLLPGATAVPVQFRARTERDGVVDLGPTKIGALTLRLRITQKNPSLLERTLEVTADAAQRFSVNFPLEMAPEGECASFSGPEATRVVYDTGVRERRNQTFPVAMLRTSDRVFGLIADSPGLWENRCQVLFDPPMRRLAVLTGDGSDPFTMIIKPPEDARDTYQYQMDGWQSLSAGETRRFTTWVFASPARNHYDAQVAAQLAVANAKGWNSSALEAILCNTSLYLLRRNLMRDENSQPRDGKYIFISGMTYGWKQWVSTGIYSALGLNDPEKTIEAYRAVFWHRMDYEENAQYYLIWAALARRAGGTVNEILTRKAYEFIQQHERDGFYIPPPLPGAPHPKGWKTYMDVLHYDDDDAPASNQGFHCGALMAAKELGLPVTEQDIERAIAAYQRIFNVKLGFMPTSLKQQEILGQDTLYGATLTYAVFGRKVLTDEQVLTHYRTSEKVKSPYGLRVISAADGSLLPGHNGAYCYGGSWFFCDSGNYLLAGVHGLPAAEVNARLIERIKLEFAKNPAFNEDINTVTGQPHGNTPYADYSVYTWLRKEIRSRLKQTGPDPVGTAIDARLGVVSANGVLRLEPDRAEKAPEQTRRVLYNFDGDSCLSTKAGGKGPVAVNGDDLKRLIEEVAYDGSRVDTILVCVNAQVMYYPTKVGTMRGALSTAQEREKWPASEKQRFQNLQAFFENRIDPYSVMLAEAKRRGREVLLSFRMNDDHGNDFLRTQFLADHPEWRLGTEQYRGKGAMDFGREEVRDYTFRLIEETVRRYDSDGIELDFNRFPTFFKDGSTEQRVAKMNLLVERVRKMLDDVGRHRGRRLVLAVRVPSNYGRTPPTPETARKLGCDVSAWVQHGWVDFVAVSEFLHERGDLPIGLWKQVITTVPIYGGIECTKGSGMKNLTADEYRHAATQLINAGADGVYLFNFFTSREEGQKAYEPPFEVLRNLAR